MELHLERDLKSSLGVKDEKCESLTSQRRSGKIAENVASSDGKAAEDAALTDMEWVTADWANTIWTNSVFANHGEGSCVCAKEEGDDGMGVRPGCPQSDVHLVTEMNSDNRLILPVSVGSISTKALVDTGASQNMVCSQWLRECNLPLCCAGVGNVKGFGVGNVLTVVGTVTLHVRIHHLRTKPVVFTVIRSSSAGGIPLILSAGFFLEHELEIDLERRSLRQRQNGKTLIDVYFGESGQVTKSIMSGVPCFSAQSLCLASNQMVNLEVRVQHPDPCAAPCAACEVPEACLLEEDSRLKHLQLLSGIVDLRPSVFVLVQNRGCTPRKISLGEVLGQLSTVVGLQHVPSGEVLSVQPCGSGAAPSQSSGEPELFSGEHLTSDQKKAIVDMLQRHKNVFSYGDADIGRLGCIEHKILLHDDTPICQKPRRFPQPVSDEIEAQCEELQLLDVIEPSSSAWSSPIVPVRKRDGTLRLCVDYRKLNNVTKADKFPLPNLNDAVFGLHGVKFFTSLDLVRGYYQLPLEEASREYTAFSTPRHHWQFKRLSFGLKNAPAAFQREMQHVLSGFPWRRVIVYIDDVLIMSDSFEEHLALVDKVLKTFAECGVKIKREKCTWFAEEVEFLGHVVSSEGLRKPAKYVEKVLSVPRPSTVRQLREFLGLANFQRKFVANFSSIQKPLSEKTGGRGRKKLEWDEEMEEAFHLLKEKIKEDVSLSFPHYGSEAQPLQLYVDASGRGAGACLAQEQQGETKVIAYASMTFSAPETRYSTIERELVALRWGIKAFRPFLIGSEFVLHTDHRPLMYLHNMKIIDSRLARTLEDLADFNFSIVYTPGKDNSAADALSRLGADGVSPIPGPDFDPRWLSPGLVLGKEVRGGADSLFESLWFIVSELGLTPVPSPEKLREELVDEMLKHSSRYGRNYTKDEKRKLQLVRYPGQLPPSELLLAFSQIFRCVVLVHYGTASPINYVSPGLDDILNCKRIHLQCLNGVHYNPILDTGGYDVGLPRCVPAFRPGQQAPTVRAQDENVKNGAKESTPECEGHIVWCQKHTESTDAAMKISVGGGEHCVLLDTGAQVSCISLSVVEVHSLELLPLNCIITGLGSHQCTVLGKVKLTVCLGSMSDPLLHSFLVVPDDSMPFCMLLGADYLVAHGISLDFGRRLCLQNGKSIAVLPREWQPHKLKSFLVSSSKCVDVREVCIGTGVAPFDFCEERDVDSQEIGLTSLIKPQNIKRMQNSSPVLMRLRQAIRGAHGWDGLLARFRRYRRELRVENSVITYITAEERPTVVVTFSFLVEVLLVVHRHMAHIGRQKLQKLVRQHVWHPSLAKVAGDVTRTCDACQKKKVSSIVAPPVVKIQTTHPFELIAMDLVALPSSRGNVGCLVAMDHYSKWLCAVPIANKTSATIAAAVERRIFPSLLRIPLRVLTDNGPEFVGAPFEELLSEYGVHHLQTTPGQPSSNGLVERANRTLIELLRVESLSPHRWVEALPRVLSIHNGTYHSSLEASPSECLLRGNHRLRDVAIVPNQVTGNWREGHPSFRSYELGDKVVKKMSTNSRETSVKFLNRFNGPYVIEAVNQNGVTYRIRCVADGIEGRAHHSQLRRYEDPPDYIVRHPYYQSLLTEDIPFVEVDVEEIPFPRTSPRISAGYPSYFYDSSDNDLTESETDCASILDEDSTSEDHDTFSSPESSGSSSESASCIRDRILERGTVDVVDRSSLLPACSSEIQPGARDEPEYNAVDADALDVASSQSVFDVSIPTTHALPSGFQVDDDTEFWTLDAGCDAESLCSVVSRVPLSLDQSATEVRGAIRGLQRAVRENCEISRANCVLNFQRHIDNLQHHLELLEAEADRFATSSISMSSGAAENASGRPIQRSDQHEENMPGGEDQVGESESEALLVLHSTDEVVSGGEHELHEARSEDSASDEREITLNVRDRRMTRSQGPAPEHPHVQPRILEYDR